jgi:murein DD-endopeptidase MepM/ murein hydrolase activator NlpD
MNVMIFILMISINVFANTPVFKEMTIRPGDVRWLELELTGNDIKLYCKNNPIKVNKENNKVQAAIVETYFSDLSPFKCEFKERDQVLASILFKVEKRVFLEEKLKVNPKTIKLSPKDQERADKEQVILNKIYASSFSNILFNGSFRGPMNSIVTSVYGTRRVYNGQKKGQHLGIDYRATVGEKVPTTNSGRVVFSGDLFYTGWTVIIDHGLDIFSVYGHLSKTLVQTGQLVEKGELIGLSGNTGRTSGPHLHWGVKVQGHYIDGFVLIDETKKYFNE